MAHAKDGWSVLILCLVRGCEAGYHLPFAIYHLLGDGILSKQIGSGVKFFVLPRPPACLQLECLSKDRPQFAQALSKVFKVSRRKRMEE